MPEFSDAQAVDAYWQGEYEFFRKIITDEVDRLRWNKGLEPIEVDLYPVTVAGRNDPMFAGSLRVGRNQFAAIGTWVKDKAGAKVLKVRINVKK
jgi:hypothetical protein